MTKSQFIAQIDTLQQQLPRWEIVADKEVFSDFAIGCFYDEDTKTWKVYMNHERGWHSIRLVTDSEEEAFGRLYSLVNFEIENNR